MNERSDADKTRELIEAGAELVGAAAGPTIGMLVAGPPGAFAGAIGSVVIKDTLTHVGAELRDRLLGPRERARVGAAFIQATMKIRENVATGRTIRTDDFFIASSHGRSRAEEILEGVLLKASDSYEEKKVNLLGNLYGNLAFSSLPPADANLILSYVGDMTYRELVCLGFIPQASTLGTPPWQKMDVQSHIEIEDETLGVLHDLWDLYQRFLIHQVSTIEDVMETQRILSPGSLNPALLRPLPMGQFMIDLMELQNIPADEMETLVIKPLWLPSPSSDEPSASTGGGTTSP